MQIACKKFSLKKPRVRTKEQAQGAHLVGQGIMVLRMVAVAVAATEGAMVVAAAAHPQAAAVVAEIRLWN
jgi:hypothetical protein